MSTNYVKRSFPSEIFQKEGLKADLVELDYQLPPSFWQEYEQTQGILPINPLKSSRKVESNNINNTSTKHGDTKIEFEAFLKERDATNKILMGLEGKEMEMLLHSRSHYPSSSFLTRDIKLFQDDATELFTRSLLSPESEFNKAFRPESRIMVTSKTGLETMEKNVSLDKLMKTKHILALQSEDEKNQRLHKLKLVRYTSRFFNTIKQI